MAVIWIVIVVVMLETIERLYPPPTQFDEWTMVLTSILRIAVNVLMGFTLHQGSYKHIHKHIRAEPCTGHHHHDPCSHTDHDHVTHDQNSHLHYNNLIEFEQSINV